MQKKERGKPKKKNPRQGKRGCDPEQKRRRWPLKLPPWSLKDSYQGSWGRGGGAGVSGESLAIEK